MRKLNIEGMINVRGKPNFSKKNLPPLVSLPNKNPTCIALGLSQGL
jgi:hypothetical protein